MIKTNLAISYRPKEIPKVMGMDLGKVNFKLVVVAFLIGYFLPDMIVGPIKEAEVSQVQGQIKTLQDKDKKLQKEIRSKKTIEEEIKSLQIREERLKKRLVVVKKIIKTRKSPFNILLYIAKNVPDDLWITKLDINPEQMKLEGRSLSYKSIGKFIEALRASIFFLKDLKMKTEKAEKDPKTGVRAEVFNVTVSIGRFE
jgi:Tfp pilus assembly protein PilN